LAIDLRFSRNGAGELEWWRTRELEWWRMENGELEWWRIGEWRTGVLENWIPEPPA
jgi:hypothetical protein